MNAVSTEYLGRRVNRHLLFFSPQVRNYYMCGELKSCSLERAATIRRPVNLARRGQFHHGALLPLHIRVRPKQRHVRHL